MTNELITFDTANKASITDAGRKRLTKDRANGLSQATCAARLGIGTTTLRRIMDDDEATKAAYDEGTGSMQDELVGLLMQHARDGDRTSAIFLLKGACGFREVGPSPDAPAQQQPPQINITIPPAFSQSDIAALTAQMRDVSPDDQSETPAPKQKGITR
ncbi:MAG: hypothetical protein AAF066_03175 [Pseudomonadota bacterium]